VSRSKRARARARGRKRGGARPTLQPPNPKPQRHAGRPPTPGPPSARVLARDARPRTPTPAQRRRRARRIALAAAATLAIAAAGACWIAATTRPAWFDRTDPDRLFDQPRRAAVSLENRVSSALTSNRPDGSPWTLRIEEAEANAWLAHRLRAWLEREAPDALPDTVRRVAIDFRKDSIAVGVDHAERPAALRRERDVITVRAQPRINADTRQLTINPGALSVNSLTVPHAAAAIAQPLLSRALAERLESLTATLGADHPPSALAIRIDERRVARIRAIAIDEDAAVLSLVTTARD
jgi:hypothetical protein